MYIYLFIAGSPIDLFDHALAVRALKKKKKTTTTQKHGEIY